MKSYKVVFVENSGNECGNGLRFATEEQAHEYHADLYSRWTGCPSGYRVDPSDDPVSAKYDSGPYQCDDNGDRLPEPSDYEQVCMLSEASDRVAERHPDVMAIIHGPGVEGGEDTLARAVEFYDEQSAREYEKVRKENGYTYDICGAPLYQRPTAKIEILGLDADASAVLAKVLDI